MSNQVGYFNYEGGKNNRYRDSQGNVYHNHLGPALNSIGNAFGIKSGIKNWTDEQHERLNTKNSGSKIYGSLPSDYKDTELAAGKKAEDFRKGAGLPGQTPTVPTRDVQKANGAKGTQTSPGGGMPTLTAAGIAGILSDRKIAPGAFSSIQLPGTNTNPDSGIVQDAIPFGGQETSVTTNTLGAFSATNGQAYPALDTRAFTTEMPASLTSQFSQFGGMSLGNGAPTVAPTAAQGGKNYTEIQSSDPMFAKAFGQDLADKQNKGNTSRLNAALNDTAGMQSYMSKFGSPEQDKRRAADMAFLNAGTAQEGLRAKEAVFGQFHTGGQTYQLNDAGTELIQQDGKPRKMDKAAASSYRLGTSTAAQYKDSYKDAVKQVAASETPLTPKQAENPFVHNPAAVSTAFRTDISAGTMSPGSAEVGGMMDVVRGIDGTPPLSSQQISDSFLNKREPLMRDPRNK